MKKQSGFAVVETVLVLVIIAAIAGTAYYVWQRSHSKSTVAETSNVTKKPATSSEDDNLAAKLGKSCSAGDMKGKLLTAPKAAYSLCVPNGWRLMNYQDYPTYLDSDANGLVYTASIAPKQEVGGGHDGITAFSVQYNETAAGAPAGFNTVGPFKADNVTGTEYAYTETKATKNVEGNVPKGTQRHAYYFENGGKSIEIDYNLFPGDADHTDAVAAVAKTLIFN
ncbi:MAG TPA: hypothetical protein VFL85_00790 [Candidatus Saccharimonadales bacterium]|nr:hypothetical protein [Candidatus Saccharimonadales bacterium]